MNINVTMQRGINYQWQTIKLPLYLKILDFFDRHYNYKYLVKGIIKDVKEDEERVMKIFEWTHKNIRKVPVGLSIIDDHAWYIIVRGYGTDDQSSDVFTTLCNYAGINAFFSWISSQDNSSSIPLSFVKIGKKWYIFDPYRSVYFKNTQGDELVDVETIKSKNLWLVASSYKKELEIDYAIYFNNLASIEEIGLIRSNIQSPLKRIKYEIKKWLHK